MPLTSINPATGEKIRDYSETNAKLVKAAVERSHRVFLGWRELAIAERASHLNRVGAVLRSERESLAALATAEMGKPIRQSREEIDKCAGACDYYAAHGAGLLESFRPPKAPRQAQVAFEPLGPLLAIMPWNFPYWQVFRAAIPALLAGNTVLLKHASNVCGCALAVEDVFRRAGLPDSVFQTLLIDSSQVPALIAHPRIRAVTLTGSTNAGKSVAAAAGAALKPCVLELGGSDAYLVLHDADLALAAEVCATARLINSGQSCIAAKRFIVVEKVRAKFERQFTEQMAARQVGDPFEESTEVGPLARPDLRDELHAQVRSSLRRKARLLLGGKAIKGPGNFYPPTVLTEVSKGMPAFDQELFGPVAAVIAVPDEITAIAVANDSSFGLGAAVFTRDLARGEEIARERLEAGMTFVNAMVRSDVTLPFGGVKDSGFGRELGAWGARSFVNVKTIWVE